jgi:hypothetical protein
MSTMLLQLYRIFLYSEGINIFLYSLKKTLVIAEIENINKNLSIQSYDNNKLYGWIIFYLYNTFDIYNLNFNKIVGEGYLPINFLHIRDWKSNPLKIPIKNCINEVLIGYVIITVDTTNSTFYDTKTLSVKECSESIRDFNHLSFVYLHDIQPDIVRKYFSDMENLTDKEIQKSSLDNFNEIESVC